ncbi:MAG: 3-deoxy-D-manno-octulosonic acid transferase [Phycisphaerae bacterium]
MWLIFDALYLLGLLLLWPLLVIRRIRRGPGSVALRERLGGVPLRPVASRCVWIHAVSLGEMNATRTLVRDLHKLSPNTVIVISSTTQTGLAQARQLYPKLVVFRYPLDFSLVVRRVLDRIRPSAIVLMELEVWPNLLDLASARGIPVMIANGRITAEKSVRRFNLPLLRTVARRMFGRLEYVAAQDPTYAERFVRLGVPAARVEVTGSLKYDTAEITDFIEGQDQLASAMQIDTESPLWVCGSTGPDEEATILDAFQQLRAEFANLQLAIVPRKPERFDEVAQLIVERGLACMRRSGKPTAMPNGAARVLLGDTMGELRKFYSLATVVFVGRTLVAMGGSDMMEVAALGKATVVGPHTENFAEAMEILRERGGIVQISRSDELVKAIGDLLRDEQRRTTIGENGREAVRSKTGATAITVRRILDLIGA